MEWAPTTHQQPKVKSPHQPPPGPASSFISPPSRPKRPPGLALNTSHALWARLSKLVLSTNVVTRRLETATDAGGSLVHASSDWIDVVDVVGDVAGDVVGDTCMADNELKELLRPKDELRLIALGAACGPITKHAAIIKNVIALLATNNWYGANLCTFGLKAMAKAKIPLPGPALMT